MERTPPTDKALLFGVPVDLLTMDETVVRCRELVEARRPAQHALVNAQTAVMTSEVPGYREVLAACDVVNADGQSVVWAGGLLGVDVPERVAGPDLMERLLELAEAEGYPVFFLGARPDVLPDFQRAVMSRYPRLCIAGLHDGYFRDDEAVADEIRRSEARLLFVGISSPRKESFVSRHLGQMGPVFAMGVGGTFDIWAGRIRRAPRWMQNAGLEWLFRLLQEPQRMWTRYLVGNVKFLSLVAREWWRFRSRGGRRAAGRDLPGAGPVR